MNARPRGRFLCNALHHARCHDWAFLLAMVLRDRAALDAILDDLAVSEGGAASGGSSVYGLFCRFAAALGTPAG